MLDENFSRDLGQAIFYAPFEAARLGSKCATADHLLLSALHIDPQFFIGRSAQPLAMDKALRNRIREMGGCLPRNEALREAPLSTLAHDVLVAAAKEAGKLKHDHTGIEHLVMAILQMDPFCAAAKTLEENGITYDGLKKDFSYRNRVPEPVRLLAAVRREVVAAPEPQSERPPSPQGATTWWARMLWHGSAQHNTAE